MTPARGGEARSTPGRVWRISDRATFTELRRCGRRCRSGPLDVVWVAGPDDVPPRVAYAVGRHVGSAVVRNRVRRRLRVAASELAASGALVPGNYLVVVAPRAAEASLGTLRGRLSTACAELFGQAA